MKDSTVSCRQGMRNMRLLLGVVAITIMLPSEVQAQHRINDALSWTGALRWGYFARRRDERDATRHSSGELRLRLQMGLTARLNRMIELRTRFGGRFSPAQERLDFSFPSHIPTTDGLRLGESTFDELHVALRPHERLTIRLGRMQTKFERAGVVRKSLDRNDSPNVDVSWTDGAHVIYRASSNWLVHGVVQHNSPKGPTNVLRPPLEFSEPSSRVTLFAGIENNAPWGPIVQRGLDLTYIPRALLEHGILDGPRSDYLAITGRAAAEWPLSNTGAKWMLSGELGYAPTTPMKAALGTGEAGEGRGGGLAYEASIHFRNLPRNQNFGFAAGWIDDGWLISPDYRNNNFQTEFRYRWEFHPRINFEARIRTREDRAPVLRSLRTREETDVYFRMTYRM